MSSTVPSPNIDIGIRPMTPAAENRQAPGIRRTSAYGRSGRASSPAGERLSRRSAISRSVSQTTTLSEPVNRVPESSPPPPRLASRGPWLDGNMPAYDAFLLVSFGGPEGPDDVMPFLQNVTRGRGIPPERVASVAEHYYAVGGVSPINQQCRDMLAAVRADLEASDLALPLYWGNRNWAPYLADTLRTMADDGVRRAVAFVTSAYSSFSSCRQYLDDIERARAEVGPRAPQVDK